MNWIDLFIIIFLVFFALEGFRKSFISETLDLLSFLLAFFLSLRFYNQAASVLQTNFQLPHSISNILGFILVWFLAEILFFIGIRTILPRLKILLSFDKKLRPLAILPAILRGLVLIAVMLVLVGSFPIQPKIKSAVQQSKLGSYILNQAQGLETPLKNVFGGVSNDSLTFLTVKPKTDERIDLGFKTAEFKENPSLEEQMVNLVNQERTSRGLNALRFNSQLRTVGRVHSADMFKRGYFSHYSPEGKSVANRAEDQGIDYMVIGENLAYAPNLETAHKGLMNSEGHRANILLPDYNEIGIGIMDGGVYGVMVTQIFKN